MTILVNNYATLIIPPPIDFDCEILCQYSANDPAFVELLNGTISYVINAGDSKMNSVRYDLWNHMKRVKHYSSIKVQETSIEQFIDWAHRANAVTLFHDGSICDPHGYVLLYPSGQPADPDAKVPYPQSAIQRKLKTEALLKEKKIKFLTNLPPVVGEKEAEFRTPEEIIERIMALMIVADYTDGLINHSQLSLAMLKEYYPVGYHALTIKERHFVTDSMVKESDITNMSWCYESMQILLWAISWCDTLPFATEYCEPSQLKKTALEQQQKTKIEAQLRSKSEILDALDLHYRLHWTVRQNCIDKDPTPTNLLSGVIYERHHALNWLTCYENADWDDVDTPT